MLEVDGVFCWLQKSKRVLLSGLIIGASSLWVKSEAFPIFKHSQDMTHPEPDISRSGSIRLSTLIPPTAKDHLCISGQTD